MDGQYELMQSSGGLRPIAIDKFSDKIIGPSTISPDRMVGSIAGITIVWQIMSIITAQKFLSDINKKLASIEDRVKDIFNFLKAQERGQINGNIKYVAEIERRLKNGMDSKNVMVVRYQLETVYRESIYIVESNLIKLKSDVDDIKNKKLDGNLEEKENFFRKKINSYLENATCIIGSYFVMVSVEHVKSIIKINSISKELNRVQKIKRETKDFLEKIQEDEKFIRERAKKIKSNLLEKLPFRNSEDKIKKAKKNIGKAIDELVETCDKIFESINYRLKSIKNLDNYVENLKKNGMEIIISVDTLGKIEKIGYISEDNKKKAA